MATQNSGRGSGGRSARGSGRGAQQRGRANAGGRGGAAARGGRSGARAAAAETPPEIIAPGIFRLGVVPGATPGKWIDRWQEQRPQQPIEMVPLSVAGQRAALDAGQIDAAIVRLPLAGPDDDVHVIRLYDEVPVVVAAVDASLMAAEELTADDLAGEVLIVAADDVYDGLELPTEPAKFAQPSSAEDAIEIAATGVGIVVVPMSIARAHHRRDVDFRPLVGAPDSTVALAWLRDRDAEDVQHLAGITRGRGARSSR